MKNPRHIVITGASSGIGAALALYYAQAGNILLLTGRDGARLAEIGDACRARGADVRLHQVDVCDRDAMGALLCAFDEDVPGGVDLVIANAGISSGSAGLDNIDRAVFAVNLDGVLNTIEPLVPRMCTRGRGQIALISSMASFNGWPGAPAYSASKGAVRLYGEALRGTLAPRGVAVNVVCPGFVISRMTDVNDFPMPLLMSAERAAQKIAHGLARDRGRIAFPWPVFLVVGMLGMLPYWLSDRILRRFPDKPLTPQQ